MEDTHLNPDQGEGRPSKESMGVLEAVVEPLAHSRKGEDEDTKKLSQDDIGDCDSSDRGLEKRLFRIEAKNKKQNKLTGP